MASRVGTEPIMLCSKVRPRCDETANPPTWLAVFWVYLPVVCTCHTIPHPYQPGRGTNHPPAIPKDVPALQMAGWDWEMYTPHLARCVQRCSILHIVVGYICATYPTLMYTTYVDVLGEERGLLYPYHGVLYWSTTLVKENDRMSTVYGIQHTRNGLEKCWHHVTGPA